MYRKRKTGVNNSNPLLNLSRASNTTVSSSASSTNVTSCSNVSQNSRSTVSTQQNSKSSSRTVSTQEDVNLDNSINEAATGDSDVNAADETTTLSETAPESTEPEIMDVDEAASIPEYNISDTEEPATSVAKKSKKPANSGKRKRKNVPAASQMPAPISNPDPVYLIDDIRFRSTLTEFHQVVQTQWEVLRTQASLPIEPVGQLDNTLQGEFIMKLRDINVQVMKQSTDGERYFFIGHRNHAQIVRDIDKKLLKNDDVLGEIFELLKNDLNEDVKMWLLFLKPSKNDYDFQDSIFRALLLSQPFQTEIFSLFMSRLDSIARGTLGTEWIDVVDLIVLHLRCIIPIYQVKQFFTIIFSKLIESWPSDFRDKFIVLIPELLIDSTVACDTAKKLVEFILLRDLEKENNFRRGCLEALIPLKLTPKIRKRLQFVLSKNLMIFDNATLPTAVLTILHVMDRIHPTSFKNLVVYLHKFLDIDKLKRNENDCGESLPLDECLAQSFNHIYNYIQFHFDSCHRDFLKIFAMEKLCVNGNNRDNVVANTTSNDPDKDYEISDDDETDSEDGSDIFVVLRDLDVIDVFLMFIFFKFRPDLPLIMKEIKKRVESTFDTFVTIKTLFTDALKHTKFITKYFDGVIAVAHCMIFVESPRMNAIGTALFIELFISQPMHRLETLTALKIHVCEYNHEATVALQVFENIAETNTQLLRPFLQYINEFVHCIYVFSTENVRRLFFVLVSINQFSDVSVGPSTQQIRIDEGKKFMILLNSYLTSLRPQRVIWGIVGLTQKIKALLSVSNTCENERDSEVTYFLNELEEKTDAFGGSVRSEFYKQLSSLLKCKLKPSCSLYNFGVLLLEDIRKRFFCIRVDALDSTTFSQLNLGQYDSESFVDVSSNLWINVCDLVWKDTHLEGLILSLLPMLEAAKAFAIYSDNFRSNYEFDSNADSNRTSLWDSILFILEANINLSLLSNAPENSDEDIRKRCDVLYVTVEYLRTVLNLFEDCYINDRVTQLMEKRLNLLFYCEKQLKLNIKKLKMYELPKLTSVNTVNLIVQNKENVKKPATKRKEKPQDEDPLNESTAMDVDPEMFSDDSHDIFAEIPDADMSTTQPLDSNESDETSRALGVKRDVIHVEQLSWYCTPLRLETITRMLQVVGMKRNTVLSLVEILYAMLLHTMPTLNNRTTISGFGTASSTPIPLSLMDFGTKEQRWKTLSSAIPCIFDILNRTVDSFTQNTAQVPNSNPADFIQEMTSLLKYTVLIFSRIFQSKDINDFITNDSLGVTGVRSRRDTIIEALTNVIGVFNVSRVGQGHDRETSAATTRPGTAASNCAASGTGRESHGSSTTTVEMTSRNNTEETIVDFFLEVGNLVPTAETATAVLALLRSFKAITEFQKNAAAKTALFLLSKNWSDSPADTFVPTGSEDKQAILVAEEYLEFRPSKDRLNAVIWLVTHQLSSVFPQNFLEKEGVVIDDFDDTEAYVNQYKDNVFPCFNKKSFSMWYKLLFKHFVDSVLKDLDTSNIDFVHRPRAFVTQWSTVAKTFFLFSLALRDKGFRIQRVLVTAAREAKRFLAFVMTKKSSFRRAIQDDRKMALYCDELLTTLKRIQLANRTFQRLRSEALKRRSSVLLRLIAELNLAHEAFTNQFQMAAAECGFFNNVSFGELKNKTLDGTEAVEDDSVSKKRKTTNVADNDSNTSIEVISIKKKKPSKKRGATKSTSNAASVFVKQEPDESRFVNESSRYHNLDPPENKIKTS